MKNYTDFCLKNNQSNYLNNRQILACEIHKDYLYQIVDYYLPTPNHIGTPNNIDYCLVVWFIDGLLHSQNSKRFFVDVQKRLKKSIETLKIRDIKFKELNLLVNKIDYSHFEECRLKDFSSLQSIGYDKIEIDPVLFIEKKNKNSFFNYARKVANRILIDKKCKKQIPEFTEDELFFATQEGHYLAKSAKGVKYIIRNIHKWYEEKEFTTRKQSKRNRVDNAVYQNKKRTDQTFKLIFETIKTNKIADVSKIAKLCDLSRTTIYRYFKSFFSFFRELFSELNLICSFFRESLQSFVEIVFSCSEVVKPLKSTVCNTIRDLVDIRDEIKIMSQKQDIYGVEVNYETEYSMPVI